MNVTSFDQSESHTVSPVSNELKPLLERPLKFEYKEGKVGQIFCNDDEPEYILNIKRGVLSMIHHNFTKPESSLHHREPRLYKNWEVSWKVSTSLMCHKMDESNKLCFGRLWVVPKMTSIPQIFVFRFPHLKPFLRRQEKHFEIVEYASWKFAPFRNPPCFPYPKANCITIKPPTYFYTLKESLQVFIYIITFLSRMLH